MKLYIHHISTYPDKENTGEVKLRIAYLMPVEDVVTGARRNLGHPSVSQAGEPQWWEVLKAGPGYYECEQTYTVFQGKPEPRFHPVKFLGKE